MGEHADGHASRTFGDIDLTGSGEAAAPSSAPVLTADPPAGPDLAVLQERLDRVERLLEADLSALGPSVVAASIDELLARIDAVAARVDDLGRRLDDVATTPAAAATPADATVTTADGTAAIGPNAAAGITQRLDSIDRRVDRLTLLVEAATAPLEEDAEPTDPAIRRIEQALVGLTVIVQRIAAIAEDPDAAR